MTTDGEVGSNVTTQDLLRLAESILTSTASVEDIVQLIERYSSLFQKWCDMHPEVFSDSASSVPVPLMESEVIELRELLLKHEQVLGKAQSLKDATAHQLRGHRAKGKGIMAYLDRLPKVVSTRKSKKG